MTEPTDQSVAAPGRPRNRSDRQIQESAANKAAIVRAAASAFAGHGYTQTTLAGVAKLVGLTRQGVLHHFPTKEALFLAVLDEEKDWAEQQITPLREASGLPAIRELAPFLGGSEAARTPLQLIHVLEGEGISGNETARDYVTMRAEQVRGEILRRLERSQAAGEIPASADVRSAAALISAAVNGLQKTWLLDQDVDTLAAFDLLVEALRGHFATKA